MKKRILGLILAASIATGVGGYGTYAYFTGSDKLKDDVNITMGNIDVDAYWATDAGKTQWKATSGATEVKSSTADTLTFENAKPGDTFERDVVVANMGSLKADMSVAYNTELSDIVDVELVNVTSQTGKVLLDPNVAHRYYENAVGANGGWIRGTVRITIKKETGNEWMNKVINKEAHDFITVGAHQTIY